MKIYPLLCALIMSVAWASDPGMDKTSASADQALIALKNASSPVAISAPVAGTKLTKIQRDSELTRQATAFMDAAQLAREYQTKYPTDPNLGVARTIEVTSYLRAVRAGDTAHETVALQLAGTYIADERNSRRDRYLIDAMVKEWSVRKKGVLDLETRFAAYELNAAVLAKDYPDVPEVHHLFLGLARTAPDAARARKYANQLLSSDAPPELKTEAQAVLDRLEMVGRTLPLRFTVNNGTYFDLAANGGKPVVIYLWASGTTSEAAMPLIRAAASSFTAVFVGVGLGSPFASAAPDGKPLLGLQHMEPLGLNGEVPRQLRANQFPSVYVFDATGILCGFGRPAQLQDLLSKAGAKAVSP